MTGFDPTPIVVASISAAGGIVASLYAYNASRKTKTRVDNLPSDLVKGFAKLQPGVDTVEKVVELLYVEIGRLTKENGELRNRVEKLISEKQDLLDEIRKMQTALDEQRTKLVNLERRIKSSIDK